MGGATGVQEPQEAKDKVQTSQSKEARSFPKDLQNADQSGAPGQGWGHRMDQTSSLPMRRSPKPGLPELPSPAPSRAPIHPSKPHSGHSPPPGLPPSSRGLVSLLPPVPSHHAVCCHISAPGLGKGKNSLRPNGDAHAQGLFSPLRHWLAVNPGQPRPSPASSLLMSEEGRDRMCLCGAFQLETSLTFSRLMETPIGVKNGCGKAL